MSCAPSGSERNSNNTHAIEHESTKTYFSFDEVVHYQLDFDKKLIGSLLENARQSEFDSLKKAVILGGYPVQMSESTLPELLKQIGYKESRVNQNKFSAINDIFSNKDVGDLLVTSCINVYRDILVFKKNNNVVGLAKICFDCKAHHILGTSISTEGFGQNGDYEKLENLLKF